MSIQYSKRPFETINIAQQNCILLIGICNMDWTVKDILDILDDCAQAFTFPVLDNGYVYLAGTRLSVYRSQVNWAIVIEVFGFSPRSGEPDTHIYTFSSNLQNRQSASNYVSKEAFDRYIDNNPHNESKFIFPIENNDWQDADDSEYLNQNGSCRLRGLDIALPDLAGYAESCVDLEEERCLTFEFCRYLAYKHRDMVFCTEEERRVSIAPEMELILQLDEWHHPDISGDEVPSSSETFERIAEVITTGISDAYKVTKLPNTHWKNWPEAGTL